MNKNLLTNWGASQRMMPENVQQLKTKILAEHSILPKITRIRLANFTKYIFPATALVVLMVVFSISKFKSTPTNLAINSINPSNLENQGVAETFIGQSYLEDSVANSQIYQTEQSQPTDLSARSITAPVMENKNKLNAQSLSLNPEEYYYTEPERISFPQINRKVPIKDNREFLKTSYSANINALNVTKTTDSVTSLIKSFDGRLDSVSVNTNTAQISFVIPYSKLNVFKDNVKNIAGAKLYLETISSENKLTEKQVIEKNSKNKQDEVDSFKANLTELTNQHTKTVSNLESSIQSLRKQLSQAKAEIALNTLNIDLQNAVKNLESKLNYQIQSLNIENSNYTYYKETLEYQILGSSKSLENIKQQDQDLLDSVATVTGVIVVHKINWFEYVNSYLPFYISLPVLFVSLVIWVVFKKRKVILLP